MITSTRKTIKLKSAFLLCSFFFIAALSKAQQVTEIITDFGGYWRTNTTTNNSTKPTDSHNLLAFTVGGTLYSTGANNAVLTSKGVSFTNGNFKCLPITSVTGTITSVPSVIGLAVNYDGVPGGFSNPLPTVKMKDVLTDGINGLNIGTGVIDIPVSARLSFPVQSIDANSIADAKPDILFTQIADISPGYTDTMYFVNSAGVVVGNKKVVDWNSVSVLANYLVDFYDLQTNVPCDQAAITGGRVANNTRPLRLLAFKLSDFGITVANKASVATLILRPSGKSDVGFVAYNTDGFVIAPPAITTQPQTKVVCAGAGSSATFSVTATGTANTYQWRKNGVDIAGATSSSYTVSPVTASSAGTYDVLITNSAGTVTSDPVYLNTEITRQPTPAQTIVTGNTVRLSVSATNASSFQWKKDNVNIAGATDSVYTISPLNTTDGGTYTVSAINSTNSCATVISNPAVITPAIVVYSKSTPDINIPSTWGANTDGRGSTPVDFTRAEHTFVLSNRDSGNTLTDLTIAGTLDVKDGVAIIADSTTLDVGHAIRTGTGSIAGSSSASFTVRGNSDVYFNDSSQLLKNFTVAGGTVNMLSPLVITGGTLPGKLNLIGGTLALGSNQITIRSTSPTNTSMVTAIDPSASITYGNGGAFLVERFIPGKRSYRFFSPAVTTTTSIKTNWMEGVTNPTRWINYNPLPGYGTHITGPRTAADSLDVTQTYNPSLFTFDKNKQTWNAVPNSHSTLTAGDAFRFMIRGSRAVDLNDNEAAPSNTIIRTTGFLTTGTRAVDSSVLSNKPGTYSFIGNPYACPINWNTLKRSGLSASYYEWDESLNKRGTYISYNSLAQTNSNSASLIDENIQSSQSFLVLTTSTTPSLVFEEATKSYTNTKVFRDAGTMAKLSVQLLLNLDGGGINSADGFVAVFRDDFSKEIGDEDSYKFNNLDENIAINRNGTPLSIEGRPTIVATDTLPIKAWQFRQNDYSLKIDGQNFAPSIAAVLKDAYLNRETTLDLSSSTVIPFSITADSASFANDRFAIVFKNVAPPPVAYTSIKAYHRHRGIQVEWNTGWEGSVKSYEVQQSVNNKKYSSQHVTPAVADEQASHHYEWFDAKASNSNNNYYRVKIIDTAGNISYSAVARVTSDDDKEITTAVEIKESTALVQPENVDAGKYAVRIFNGAGQKVYSGTVQYTGNQSLQALLSNRKLPKGLYIIQLSNEKTNTTKRLFAQ